MEERIGEKRLNLDSLKWKYLSKRLHGTRATVAARRKHNAEFTHPLHINSHYGVPTNIVSKCHPMAIIHGVARNKHANILNLMGCKMLGNTKMFLFNKSSFPWQACDFAISNHTIKMHGSQFPIKQLSTKQNSAGKFPLYNKRRVP